MADKKKIIYADDLQKSIVDDVTIKGSAFAAIMRHLQDAPAVQEWISVKDRLPEENTAVMTYRESGIQVEFRWHKGWDNDEFTPCQVTHWMPLPQPPKGE